MAKYLLAVHQREGDPVPSDEEMQRAYAQVDAFNEQVQRAGSWVFAGGLQPPKEATVVSGRGDDTLTTDGPFVESKEHLGGFWIIEADDLDAALDWAHRGAIACMNPVEVQPFADFSDVAPVAEEPPHFLLSVHVGGDRGQEPMTDQQRQDSWQEMQRLEADMQAQGAWGYSARLAGPDTATVVRTEGGDPVLTDGPFAESKEHLGGFYIIGAPDHAAALEWAERVTACVRAPIEVRAFQA